MDDKWTVNKFIASPFESVPSADPTNHSVLWNPGPVVARVERLMITTYAAVAHRFELRRISAVTAANQMVRIASDMSEASRGALSKMLRSANTRNPTCVVYQGNASDLGATTSLTVTLEERLRRVIGGLLITSAGYKSPDIFDMIDTPIFVGPGEGLVLRSIQASGSSVLNAVWEWRESVR